MEFRKFPIEFVERTKHLLECYKGDYEVSNTLNCTLGLVILPYETNRGFLSNVLLEKLEQTLGIEIRYLRNIENNRISNCRELLRRIRNGLSHRHIIPKSTEGNVTGVTIWDYDRRSCSCNESRNDNEQTVYEKCAEVEFEFTCEGLKEFALFIADKYLEAMKRH